MCFHYKPQLVIFIFISSLCICIRFPPLYSPLLTCFIMVGRELVQHLTIHSQDPLLEDTGIRESALSLLSLKSLQLLLQGFWQVGLHIVSCSLGEGEGGREEEEGVVSKGGRTEGGLELEVDM